MVNRKFGTLLIMTFHSHVLNSESTYSELNKLTQFSRTENKNGSQWLPVTV